MKKQLISIALALSFFPALPSRAQVVESLVGGSACAASVGCGVIVGVVVIAGVGYYVLNVNGHKYRFQPYQLEIHSYPRPQPGPRPVAPGAVYTRGSDDGRAYPPNQTIRVVKEYQGCQDMLKRARQAGFKVVIHEIKPNPTRGSFFLWMCVFAGEPREIRRFERYYR